MIWLLGISLSVQAQYAFPGRQVTLQGSGQDSHTKVIKPLRFQQAQRGGGFPSTFTVNYTGFSAAQEAAFQYAVDLWAAELFETIPITIDANFTSISGGGLASGGPNSFYSSFTGIPVSGMKYPIAMVNQYEGCDQEPLASDMTININSDSTWYDGVDASPGSGQYDLVTVVMHQIAHGLGIIGTAKYGAVDCGIIGGGCLGSPMTIYDNHIANGVGTYLSSQTNPSAALGGELVSNNLYFYGTNAASGNGGPNPQIEATSTFSEASDYSFLDEAAYPAGNPHSLVTPVIGTAEAIHDPGDVVRGILKDIGWTLAENAAAGIDVRTVFYAGMSLDFHDASSQATSWEWDFENDGFTDATTQNPSHTYATAGTYTVKLTINGGASTVFETVEIFDLPGPDYPYIQDFESGIAGWYEVSGGCDQWELGAANSGFYKPANFNATIAGSASWVTNLMSGHGSNTEYYLESPPFSLQGAIGNYLLIFEYRYVGGINTGFNVQYSIDSGTTWNVLGTQGAGWYNSASITGLNGEPGFNTYAFAPTIVTQNIDALKGNPDVRFRFKFGTLTASVPDDGAQIDNFTIDGSVLDAEEIQLNGVNRNNQILLTWTTEKEYKTDFFDLERSSDGQDFQKIGQVKGNGTTYQPTEYEYTDANPYSGINYYRLKQVNEYGLHVYSDPIQVRFSPESLFTLGPNPADQTLNFKVFQQSKDYPIEFRLMSVTGQLRLILLIRLRVIILAR
ncbi:MAG: PKD domain-containing protein [Bacteroidia bacterium]